MQEKYILRLRPKNRFPSVKQGAAKSGLDSGPANLKFRFWIEEDTEIS